MKNRYLFFLVLLGGIFFWGSTAKAAVCICDVLDTATGATQKSQVVSLKLENPGCQNGHLNGNNSYLNCKMTEEPSKAALVPVSPGNPSFEWDSHKGFNGVDMRCFKETECIIQRIDLGVSEAEAVRGGLYQGTDSIRQCGGMTDAGGERIGFCSPVGNVVTQVTFGTKNQFSNWGEFIQYMYSYGIKIAALLAVIVIIIAGVQWLTSGGSTDKISSARKRIGGALMGLFLVGTSYIILYTVNPFIVNFRPPQAWLINKQSLVPLYCDSLDSSSTVAFARDGFLTGNEDGLSSEFSKLASTSFSLDPKSKTECNKSYFPQNGGGKVCLGLACSKGQICGGAIGNKSKDCVPGVVGGVVSADPGLLTCSTEFAKAIIDGPIYLIAVHASGNIDNVGKIQNPKSNTDDARLYLIPKEGDSAGEIFDKISASEKSDNTPIVGFYLGAEINDEGGGLTGEICPGSKPSAGCDDWHAIGISAPHQCDTNLAFVAGKVLGSTPPDCIGSTRAFLCSCSTISSDKIMREHLANNPEFVSHLIKKEELERGYPCGIYITRSEFPALDNGGIFSTNSCTFLPDPTWCWNNQASFRTDEQDLKSVKGTIGEALE